MTGIRTLAGSAAAMALLSGTASAADIDFSLSGYLREHISVNLQDAPERVDPRRSGEFVGLDSRILSSDFDTLDGQGELSMARTTLKLEGLLRIGGVQFFAVGRSAREHHTAYEKRLQNAAETNPIVVLDRPIDNGIVGAALTAGFGPTSSLKAIRAAGEVFRGDVPPADPMDPFATVAGLVALQGDPSPLGETVIAGDDFGLHGGSFFHEYDDDELREAFVQFDIGRSAHFRLGRQQVVWGETDFFRAMDVIHGYDLRWRSFLEIENEELRKPLILANVSVDVPAIGGAVQFIYRPGWDGGDDIGNSLPLDGGRWAPQPLRGFDALSLSPYNPHHNTGDENAANYGVRVAGVFKQVGWSLNYYRNQSQDPVISRNPRIGGTSGIGRFEGAIGNGMRLTGPERNFGDYGLLGQPAETVFPMVDTFGATFNAYLGGRFDGVLRGEVAFVPNQPYNAGANTYLDLASFFLGYDDGVDGTTNGTGDPIPASVYMAGPPGLSPSNADLFGADNQVLFDTDGGPPAAGGCWTCVYFPGLREVKEKPTLKLMIGWDKNLHFLQDWFDTFRPVAWTTQLFDTWVLNYDSDDQLLELPGYGATRRKHTTYITSAMTFSYNYDSILPGFAIAFDAGNFDAFLLPYVDFIIGNNWRIRAEANLFFPRHTNKAFGNFRDHDTRLFGGLANHDQFAVRVTYQF